MLEPIGYTRENEHQARWPEGKAAAKVVQELAPEQVATVAKFIQTTTGSAKPTTSQIRAVAEVVQAIDDHGTVAPPVNGEPLPFTDLPEPARMAMIHENVSIGTHERLQRQKTHVQGSTIQAKSNGGA
ncbi:hypothetical protein [Deinococcus radiotolerans]|uniref:Uncharacterized protein n=1 Tax=Deinococcus radiotolerans TaxID=1309407 RepID=A0ABQ2FEX6_9DEIO|nr:hypothetical protein [Deinococcus radiotolerans]GGK91175.1 hypothetical protein GCM10010844_07110 [Deinococcus radiotolerans]